MLFGPIVNAELVRMARQRRWYVLRVLVGLFLLTVFYAAYESAMASFQFMMGASGTYNQEWITRIAVMTVGQVLFWQAVAVLLLTPALVAGAIAEEKQRKTLHYLLASRLTSPEIVVGKLVARLLVVATPILIGVPILVMVSLLGGVSPTMILMAYGATFSTALFEASLAILLSTLLRRGREALLMTFLVGFAWFFGPFLLRTVMTEALDPWAARYERWCSPWNSYLIASSPLALTDRTAVRGPATVVAAGWKMAGLQAVGIAAMLGLAIWRLRPTFRKQDGAPSVKVSTPKVVRRLFSRLWPRPRCGDHAMIWKETYGSEGSKLSTAISFLGVVTILLNAYNPIREILPAAWRDLISTGYRNAGWARQELNVILRAVLGGLFAVWALLLSIHAATSISREREDDTWISLASTPLSGAEIFGPKLLGAFWMCRHLAYGMLAVIAFGLAMGAIHPLGALLGLVHLVEFGVFLAAACSLISLGSKTTMRAVGLGFFVLFFVSIGLPVVLSMESRVAAPMAGTPSPPYLFVCGLLSYRDVDRYVLGYDVPANEFNAELVRAVVVGTIAYAAIAPVVLLIAFRMFDRLLDRPRRLSGDGRGSARAGLITTAGPAGAAPAGLPAGRA